MASSRTTLRPDLQTLLNNFTRLKNVYFALKAFSKIQDEMLQYEKAKSSKMEAEIKKIRTSFTSLENQSKETIEELRNEKEVLNIALIESQRECDRFRHVYIERNIENEKIYRLQEELEVVKAKLALQKEKYTEEISKLERHYTEELEKYRIMLESRQQQRSTKILKHPAMEHSPDKESASGRTKKRTKKEKQSYRWPKLDMLKKTEPIAKNIQNECGVDSTKPKVIGRKKKLYCENRDAVVDV